MIRSRKVKKRRASGLTVKRTGFVYSLYRENIIHLWIVTAILLAVTLGMMSKSGTYLLNYIFYRSTPDPVSLAEWSDADPLDLETAAADIDAHGGEMALSRSSTSMFYLEDVYQEGDHYRFSIEIDPDKLEDTGIYYDEEYTAYAGITSHDELEAAIPREHYAEEHLYLYEYNGTRYLLAFDLDLELEDTMRVTFAPIGKYSLFNVYDLYNAGYTGTISADLIDCRETPVDFEDEDFKDLVMILPFALVFLIVSLLMTALPGLHPTYRQLQKYGRTMAKAAEKVDANYEEFGVTDQDKKTIYLEDWLVKRSFFKNGIEKNYRKQKN